MFPLKQKSIFLYALIINQEPFSHLISFTHSLTPTFKTSIVQLKLTDTTITPVNYRFYSPHYLYLYIVEYYALFAIV